ncbi:hypothetical protein POTOM_044936 [Populus tomentosa]|uniref:FAR1 domain-containing protein n=1 Tax=Populus tomentosa TaxID=118781 RepID=A0A8X7YC71_POPTO|nr:hypothetical protein POTOM_044936 [Populus tomentosa]
MRRLLDFNGEPELQGRIRMVNMRCPRNCWVSMGGICTVSMVCSKEGANKSRGKKNKLRRPSLREGCNVSVTSSLKKDGWWKINKINLLRCHENDPNAAPFLQRYRMIPPRMRYPLVLGGGGGGGSRTQS